MHIKININIKELKINKIIKYFIISDLLLLGGWGLIGPIFSIFIIEKIQGATLITVGISAAIYFLVKSLTQLPVAIYLDKTLSEKDDFYTLILALFLAGLTALCFIMVNTIWELYLIQILHAIAFGLYVPSWSGIFSRHMDKDHYSFDWSLDSATIGLASGVTALIGGTFANFFGFNSVFIMVGILSFISAIVLLLVPHLIIPLRKRKEAMISKRSIENIDK